MTKNGSLPTERLAIYEQLTFLVHLTRLSPLLRNKASEIIRVMNSFQDRPLDVREAVSTDSVGTD